MKIFTTNGRRIKRQSSQYERFITIHIELGKTRKEARMEWKLLNAIIQVKYAQG